MFRANRWLKAAPISGRLKGSTRLWRVVCGVAPQTQQVPADSPSGEGIRVSEADGATPSAARGTRAVPEPSWLLSLLGLETGLGPSCPGELTFLE
jgi:hypothetical protein